MPDARDLPIDTTNYGLVSFTADGIVIMNPRGCDTREKALVAAAFIVTGLGLTLEEFRRYYDAVAEA